MPELQRLQIGDHKLSGGIIAESFADDPVNLWVFGAEKAMRPFFTQVARKLYLASGYGHRAGDDACTLWLPPGVAKHIPLYRSLDIAASLIRNSGFAAVSRGMKLDAALDAHRPTQPHHYLFAIGARPSGQGKGLGTALMLAGLERVDESRMPAYLESSKESNVPFYQRFGFEVTRELTPTGDCPPLWLMWREPRRRSFRLKKRACIPAGP